MTPFIINYNYEEAIKDFTQFGVIIALILLLLSYVLYILNLFWFYKLFTGMLKFISKSKKEKTDFQIESGEKLIN